MPAVGAAIVAAAGAIGGTLAAGGVGAALLRFGGGLVLNALAQRFMPKPDLGGRERTVSVRQPVAPREMVYGRVRKGGTIVFIHSTGRKNGELHLVVAVAAHRVRSIGAVYFNGEMAVDANGTAVGRFARFVGVQKNLGGQDQPALSFPVERIPDKWTPAHRLRGVAHVYLLLNWNADVFASGIPEIAFDVEGKDDILDPRTGLRGWTDNAALCVADYMADPMYGLGVQVGAEDGIDAMSLIAEANISDELVVVQGGAAQRRYTCNGVVSLAETPKSIIEAMLTSCAGQAVYTAGRWYVRTAAYRQPVTTLTPDDVREGGLRLATRVSRAENANGVRGQFISPENDWQPDDFPAYQSAAYLTEDGGDAAWRDITLPFTNSSAAAQRLARIDLERTRRQFTVDLDGKLAAWRVAPGEVVLLDYPRWGFVQKPFEVQRVALSIQDGSLVPQLTLRETSPLVYDWSVSEEQIYAAAPRTTLPSALDLGEPGTPEVVEELYTTTDGSGVKALARLSWVAAPSTFVQDYQVQGRFEAGEWLDLGRTTQTLFEVRDIAPGRWAFRVRAVSLLGVTSEWREVEQVISGLTVAPQAITGVSLQTAGGLAVLKWDQHPDLDVRIGGSIVIRHSAAAVPSWSNSVSMERIPGSTALALPPLKPGAYLLAAEDSGGRQGPVTVVRTDGVQAIAFVAAGLLQEDTAFTGAKSGVTVTSARLTLTTLGLVGAQASFAAIPRVGFLGGVRRGAVPVRVGAGSGHGAVGAAAQRHRAGRAGHRPDGGTAARHGRRMGVVHRRPRRRGGRDRGGADDAGGPGIARVYLDGLGSRGQHRGAGAGCACTRDPAHARPVVQSAGQCPAAGSRGGRLTWRRQRCGRCLTGPVRRCWTGSTTLPAHCGHRAAGRRRPARPWAVNCGLTLASALLRCASGTRRTRRGCW